VSDRFYENKIDELEEEIANFERAIRLYEENEFSRSGKEVDDTIEKIKAGKMPYYEIDDEGNFVE